ncbi:Superoxide dismutase [Fe] 3, chloroplastic [Ancistrocladus abbreviatus]
MSMACASSIPASSPIHARQLSERIKCPSSLGPRQKGKHYGLRRFPKIVAYYGLKTPPYKLNALEPYMSERTLEMHWGEHHRGHIEALNKYLGKNDILYGYTMDELVKVTYNNGNPLPEFNNAAQVWNHDFFWESMQPGGGDSPKLGLLHQLEKDFGSFANFKEKFVQAALTLFGSGWVWLVLKREDKRLVVVKTSNAVTPIVWDDIVSSHKKYPPATARFARAQAFVNLGEPKIPVA